MHWVVFSGLSGAYQYFVNHALPVLGEFRTLWRLDNSTFTKGRTNMKDEELPPLSEYLPQNKVQDETWLKPDGNGYITKYDFTAWSRNQDFFGVYGDGFGSWYINPGKDYYNGDHLKQELMVGYPSRMQLRITDAWARSWRRVMLTDHWPGASRVCDGRCGATEHDSWYPFHGILEGCPP